MRLGRQTALLVSLETTERVYWLKMLFYPHPLRVANSAPPDTLAGFEGPLRGGEERRKWREEMGKESKRKGRDGKYGKTQK